MMMAITATAGALIFENVVSLSKGFHPRLLSGSRFNLRAKPLVRSVQKVFTLNGELGAHTGPGTKHDEHPTSRALSAKNEFAVSRK